MKKINLFACVLAVLTAFSACKKDDDDSKTVMPDPVPVSPITAVPSAFTQKVLVEKFTGEWCVNCPSGSEVLKAVMNKYPGKLVAANVHQGDWLEIAQLNVLDQHLGGIGGYPRAAINRVPATGTSGQDGFVVYSRTFWEGNVDRLIDQGSDKTATSGLALETKINGDKLNVTVHCGFSNPETRDTRLTVYLVEDNITAVKQTGATSNPYIHEHTLRKVLTAGTGDAISMKSGNKTVMEFKDIDISAYKAEDLEVVAFINVVGSTSKTHEVLNVQSVKAGAFKNWD